MAKITFDPVVQSISRGLGNFVYSSCNGKAYIRKRPAKPSRVTPGQVRHRMRFGSLARCWVMLPEKMKAAWKMQSAGTDLTEYNVFMSENIERLKAGEPIRLSHGTGLPLPLIKAASNAEGEITVAYTPADTPLFLSLFTRIETETGGSDFSPAKTDSATAETTIRGLPSGSTVIVYCILADKPVAEAEKISESTGFTVLVK